jgi:hypothetical protein
LADVAREGEALGASVQCIAADVQNALVTGQRLTGPFQRNGHATPA